MQHMISARGEGDGVYQNQIHAFRDTLGTSILWILSINVGGNSLSPADTDE